MIMKQTIRVTRRGGHWEENKWVKDPSDPFPVKASVQPVPGESTEQNDEGRRKKSIISITTRAALYAAGKGRNADLVEWAGETFEVTAVKPWGTGTRLAHYKATAESLEDHVHESE